MSDNPKTDQTKHLYDLLSSFRVGMVVVRDADGILSGRPMSVAERQGLEFWFLTSRHTGLVNALSVHSEALITMQSNTRYVTLNGHARVENDRARISKNFSEADKVWFPQGPDDPNAVLVHFRPTHAEYWDMSGAHGVGYVIEAAKAYLKGEALAPKPSSNHGEVQVAGARPGLR